MSYDNRVELVIEVDTKKANTNIQGVNASFSSLERQTVASARTMTGSLNQMETAVVRLKARTKSESLITSLSLLERHAMSTARRWSAGMGQSQQAMQQAKESAQLLGHQIGIVLPEQVSKFIGQSRLLGGVLSKLFSFSIYLAAGEALISWVSRIGEKLGRWGQQSAETKRQIDELTRASREQVEQLEDYHLRLEKIRQARGMIGLEGSAKVAEEVQQMKPEVDRARVEYASLAAQYNRLYIQSREYRIVGGRREPTEAARQALKRFDQVQKDMIGAEQRYMEARETLKNKELELEKLKTAEMKRLQEERLRNLKSYVDQTRAIEISAIQDPARRIGEQRIRDLQAARVRTPGVGAGEITEREAAVTLKAIHDLQNIWLQQTRQIKEVSPLERGASEYQRQMHEQLQGLDEWVRKNKEVLEVGRDNYEAMRLAGEDMLRSARDNFNRAANAIEGFVHRTFISARSFRDVWRQALMQVADFAISQFARMAAAWWTGRTAAAGAGYFSGGTGMMTPGGVAAAAGAAGSRPDGGWAQAAGGTAGWIPRGIGSMPSWGLPFIGGLFTAAGMVRNSAARGGLYAATGLAGISALGAASVSIGGLSFAALTASLSLPVIGAIIGAGIGIGALVGWLRKSAEEKAREKIKATYGVEMRDKGILQQIVEMAKQTFGGNLDMCIRSNQVGELVRLYAMHTGQAARGLPPLVTPISLVQSGGSLYQQAQGMPSLARGTPYVPRAHNEALPGASLNGSGRSISVSITRGAINISGGGNPEDLRREIEAVLDESDRKIQRLAMRAAESNFGRREMTALQFNPGMLTS